MIRCLEGVFGTAEQIIGLENEHQLTWNSVQEACDLGHVHQCIQSDLP